MDLNRPNFNKLRNPALIKNLRNRTSVKDSELFELDSVTIQDTQATSIQDIDLFTKLRWFSCNQNQIVSLEPLTGLQHLESLDIGGNLIEDLAPLEECPRLEELVIEGYCPIRSFELLRRMPQLKRLTIAGALAPVLKQAGELPHLKQLILVDDMESVRDLPEMPKLRGLFFWNQQIRDLDSVQRYPELVNVMGKGEDIQTVEPLIHCPKLTHVDLTLSPSIELNPLLHLQDLRSISFGQTKRAQLDFFAVLPKLRKISYYEADSPHKFVREQLRSWDDDFASNPTLYTPSIKIKWVTEEEFRYFDGKHPFNVQDYDWNEEMLVSECYWMVENIRTNLSAKLEETLHFDFWALGRIRRSIPFTLEDTIGESNVDLEWVILQIQDALCRANKTWILFLSYDDTEMWIYPEHIERVGTRTIRAT